MREEGQGPSQGLDVKGLIKNYGPMAAAAAGVLLARGRGGRELIDMFRRIAPKHAKTLHESKIPYLVESDSPLFRRGPHDDGSFFVPFGSKELRASRGNYQDKHRGNSTELLSAVEGAGHGDAPYMGLINVKDDANKLGSSTHEFGHAVGFDRATKRLRDDTPTVLVQQFGSGHMDQFDNPKVQEMVKNAFLHDPALKDYLGQYLMSMSQSGRPLQRGFGELVNESWAQLVQRKAGVKPRSMADTQIFQDNLAHRNTYDSRFSRHIDNAMQHGKMPAPDHAQALATLQELLRQYGRPPVPVSPSRPSPPASPASASIRGSRVPESRR